jgi:hypothetical protein
MNGTEQAEAMAAVEGLPVGQLSWLTHSFRDTHSRSYTNREWGWRELAGIDGFVNADPNASDELKEELEFLVDLARLLVRGPIMEGDQ